MKKLIVLSGNSARNQAWGEAAAEHFGDWFSEVYMQYYDHWQTGEPNINFATELNTLKEVVAKDDVETEYIIFTKSIGSILTLLATDQKIINPNKCVLFGMPLDFALTNTFKEDLKPLSGFSVPAIAFHNRFDPVANYEVAKSALERYLPNVRLITRQGDNHNYDEFSDMEFEIKNFLNS